MTRNDAIRLLKKHGTTFVFDERHVLAAAKKQKGTVFERTRAEIDARLHNLRDFRAAISSIEIPETKKTCPGCGEDRRRDEDLLCGVCLKRIEEYPKLIAETEKLCADMVICNVPQDERLRYYEGDIPADDYVIGGALTTIIYYLGRPVPEAARDWNAPNLPAGCEIGSRDEQRIFAREAVEAVNQLDKSIRAALKEAYRRGVQKGQDLLTGLADGSLSITEMEKRVLQLTTDKNKQEDDDE